MCATKTNKNSALAHTSIKLTHLARIGLPVVTKIWR